MLHDSNCRIQVSYLCVCVYIVYKRPAVSDLTDSGIIIQNWRGNEF